MGRDDQPEGDGRLSAALSQAAHVAAAYGIGWVDRTIRQQIPGAAATVD